MNIASIPENDRRERFIASAGQTSFPFDFPIYAATDLQVLRERAGFITTLTLGTDYTVIGAGDQAGGSITLTTGAASGDIIMLLSNMPAGRSAQFVNGGDLPAGALEAEFNRLRILFQQNIRDGRNALLFPPTDPSMQDLPPIALRANRFLAFDMNGQPYAATPAAGTVLDAISRIGDSMAGPLGFTPGTAAAPGLRPNNDNASGFFQPAPGSIGVAINGVQVARFINGGLEFVPDGQGAQNRTVQSKLKEIVSIKDFGAVGDGTTNDEPAVAAANSFAGKKFVPAGVFDTLTLSTGLAGPFYGEGQIRDAANNNRAPWFSAISSPPSSVGNFDSVETAFNGDLSKTQIAMEHRVTGVATLGQPTSGYLYRPEAFPFFGYLYNSSGWNQSTNSNSGRTGVAFQRVQVFQAGQGDAVCYNASAFVTGQRAGATNFLANPAACLFNGDIQAGANGVYLNPGEFALRDGGYDVAAVGWIANLYRTNAGGALGCFWAGFRAQSQGTQPADQAFAATGAFRNGIDFAMAMTDFGTNQSAISLKSGQRIYFNNFSSNGQWTNGYNGDYITYSSVIAGLNFVVGGNSRFQINSNQVTINAVALLSNNKVFFTALNNYTDDAAAAAGEIAVGQLYRTGSVIKVRVT